MRGFERQHFLLSLDGHWLDERNKAPTILMSNKRVDNNLDTTDHYL